MTFQLLTRCCIPSLAILCLASNLAQSDQPDDRDPPNQSTGAESSRNCGSSVAGDSKDQADRATRNASSTCDDSDATTDDTCVNGECANAPVVACPCADEYAAAVAAYNALSGAPLTAWLQCSDFVAGTDGRIAYSTKAVPAPPNWFTVILVAKGRWGYGHGIARLCEAWNYEGLAGDWGRPPLGTPTHGRHSKISTAEVLACEKLIRATAVCPN